MNVIYFNHKRAHVNNLITMSYKTISNVSFQMNMLTVHQYISVAGAISLHFILSNDTAELVETIAITN